MVLFSQLQLFSQLLYTGSALATASSDSSIAIITSHPDSSTAIITPRRDVSSSSPPSCPANVLSFSAQTSSSTPFFLETGSSRLFVNGMETLISYNLAAIFYCFKCPSLQQVRTTIETSHLIHRAARVSSSPTRMKTKRLPLSTSAPPRLVARLTPR